MPAWITSLLRELAPVPKLSAASRIRTSRPAVASARATARPTTPAPMITLSMLSTERSLENIGAERGGKRVPDVTYRLESGVAVLEIDHPPVNALSLQVREGLVEGLRRAASEAQVKAIVIAGARGSFPAGADINEIVSGLSHKSPTIREVQARMEMTDKPIVAALEG